MEARLVAASVALALIMVACASSPPRPSPTVPPLARGTGATPAPVDTGTSPDRTRPRLVFEFDSPADRGVPVLASLDSDAPTSFLGWRGEEGEIRRSVMRPGAAGDETWYEIETSRGHGFVRDTTVKDVRWVPGEGAPRETLSETAVVARGEPRTGHRIAYDVQFVESPAMAPVEPVEAVPRTSGTADVVTINASSPGERIDVTRHLVPGRYTIVDFYSEHCGPCRKLAPQLEAWSAANPRLAVRKVDIDRRGSKGIDWGSPIAQDYHLAGIPYIRLYDPEGNLVADGDAALSEIRTLARR